MMHLDVWDNVVQEPSEIWAPVKSVKGLLSAMFGMLPVAYKVPNSYVKVLVKIHESKVFPDTFKRVAYLFYK